MTEPFAHAARTHAKMHGLPDLPMIVVPSDYLDRSDAAVAEKLGRRWTLIERERKHVNKLIIPRLSAVVSGVDQTGLNKVMETHTGGRFEVCKVTRKQLECVDTVVGGAS